MRNENLKYLSTDQALVDLRDFIYHINKRYRFSYSTKWVAFGSFYGGTLAVWLRFKYPYLIHAAVAASSPLAAKLDFHGKYIKIIIENI